MDMYQETRERITEFLEQYVRPNPEVLTQDGYFSDAGIEFAIEMLLDSGVFENEEDLKRQGIKDFSVIFPDDMFRRARRKSKN